MKRHYMAAGISLAQHYALEAQRLDEAAGVSDQLRRAQRLLDWLHTNWTETHVSLPNIYQGTRVAKGKAEARTLTKILEDHGWLRKLDGSFEVAGQMRREVYEIVMSKRPC